MRGKLTVGNWKMRIAARRSRLNASKLLCRQPWN
jgi:hypothetical protein